MFEQRKVYAIIGAAGSGRRMAAPLPKQFLKIGKKTILETTVDQFNTSSLVDEIVIVTAGEYKDFCCRFFTDEIDEGKISVVEGGKERQDSISNALTYIVSHGGCGEDLVLIHDGVRPYVSRELIERVTKEAAASGAAVAAVPTKDTIRHAEQGTLDRTQLYNVQTPQAFTLSVIKESFDQATKQGFYGTDDGGLVQRAGYKVSLVAGEETNVKITTPEDLKMETRIGTGYDVHKLVSGRKLIIGGVEIPYEKGLLGHSDADVLIHALMDAMLGAAALGDIGKVFPDNDGTYKDVSSLLLLERIGEMISGEGYSLGNADVTVICQKPKLAEHIPLMRKNMAEALGVPMEKISVKATTTEHLGFAGRGEGIAAEAVCLLNR